MPRGDCQLDHSLKGPFTLFVQLFGGPCFTYLASREEDPFLLYDSEATVMLMPLEGIVLSYAPRGCFLKKVLSYWLRGRSLRDPLSSYYIFQLSKCFSQGVFAFLTNCSFILQSAWSSMEVCRSIHLSCELLPPTHFEEVTSSVSRWYVIFHIAPLTTWTHYASRWLAIFHIAPLALWICIRFRSISLFKEDSTLVVHLKLCIKPVPLVGSRRPFLSKNWYSSCGVLE